MLGGECPRCRRRNPVGERTRCLYCGAALDGPGDGGGDDSASLPDEDDPDATRARIAEPAMAFTDPDDVEITAWDRIQASLRSWPGFVLLFAVLFGGGLLFYERTMAHYAPGLSQLEGRPRSSGGPVGKSVTEMKQEAEKALEEIDRMLAASAREHQGGPETLSPDLAELAPFGDVPGALQKLHANRIGSYKRIKAPDGSKETYHLDARVPDRDRSVTAIGGTYFPGG
ncbi:MAG: hypothetical protein U0166_28940 [Acidobacteriota bacterium]